jgi:RNA polymerase sigma-70 factor (ECF subfamily)
MGQPPGAPVLPFRARRDPRAAPEQARGARGSEPPTTAAGSGSVARADAREPEPLSDEALVAACATGDTAALAALFDRHNRLVLRFVSRASTAGAGDAEDLAQTTFIEMWRASPQFRGRGSARSWILGIAANLVRHYVRGEVRRRSAMAGLAEHPERGAVRPDDLAARRQLLDRLAAAIDDLPHDLRVAFVLCDLEEVPAVEAARALGVRQGTMWRRLHDARRRLRDILAGRSSP